MKKKPVNLIVVVVVLESHETVAFPRRIYMKEFWRNGHVQRCLVLLQSKNRNQKRSTDKETNKQPNINKWFDSWVWITEKKKNHQNSIEWKHELECGQKMISLRNQNAQWAMKHASNDDNIRYRRTIFGVFFSFCLFWCLLEFTEFDRKILKKIELLRRCLNIVVWSMFKGFMVWTNI